MTPNHGGDGMKMPRHAAGEAADLRDALACERTKLANERTFLAYLRTAMAFGVIGTPLVIMSDPGVFQGLGIGLAGFGGVTLIVGLVRFMTMRERIRELDGE